jgi:hypothetical protein
LKEMSAKIEHVKPAYFFDLVQEFSDTSHTWKKQRRGNTSLNFDAARHMNDLDILQRLHTSWSNKSECACKVKVSILSVH